jgi:hypothetical protein
MNLFEEAVRQQIRFDINGQINIEQLYNARRTSNFKESLISYEEDLTKEVKAFGERTRRTSVEKTNKQKVTELKLAIITSLIDEIEIDEKDAKEKADNQERKQKLLALKAKKQDMAEEEMSIEEIDAQLALLK